VFLGDFNAVMSIRERFRDTVEDEVPQARH
jgi:hypothetical protein